MQCIVGLGARYNIRMLRIRVGHETSKATLVQFIVGTVLALLSGGASILTGCVGASGADCVSNAFVSLLLVLFTVAGYGLLLAIGFWAQERRSPRLCLLLLAVEAGAAIIFLFDAKQAPDSIDRISNLASFLLAVWVGLVAVNLYRSRGARIVRRRPKV